MQTLQSLLSQIAKVLDRENVPYMVVGGQAVMIYGEPRMTKDIDITLGFDADSLPMIKKITAELGLESIIKDEEEFVRKNSVLPLTDHSKSLRVDFIFSFMPYERGAIQRAHRVDIEGVKVAYASIEDIVIHKIFSGRPRDLEDIRGILKKNSNIDKEMIIKWLGPFSATVGRDLVKIFGEIEK